MSKPLIKPRKKPTQPRAMATVEALLEATAHILVAEGYDALTTNGVAERAGVSIGSLYQYYPNKEALISALIEQHTERILAIIASSVRDSLDLPVPDLAADLIRGLIDASLEEPDLHRALKEQVPHSPTLCGMHEYAEQVMNMVEMILLKKRHEIRPVDAKLAAFILSHAVEGVIYAAILQNDVATSREALTREVATMIVRYLAPG